MVERDWRTEVCMYICILCVCMQVRYLQDYASKQDLKIEYETEIKSVRRWVDNSVLYHLLDQNSHTHICRTVLVW